MAIKMTEALAVDLCEIIEALEIPVVTNSADQLIAVVERCKSTLSDSEMMDALDKAHSIFVSRRGHEPERFLFSRNRAAEDAAATMKSAFPSWPHYVYHGTSSKALSSIVDHGLIPNGGKSPWSGIVDDDYLSAGVFLTPSWRGAVSWAQATALTRTFQLRKDGSVPVIIQIKVNSMHLDNDVRARRPGCLMHPGDIDVSDAKCFAMTERNGQSPESLPVWLSIYEMVEMFPSKKASRKSPEASFRPFV
ncbi:hypothetical protein [Rhizobium sp. BK176]|uniref:hypothetical protein n=1 Tax=Rhizobium sp. BK176 TaxID=2587071 RepID=UPI00216730B6|nr:hypothetical protein [Rhizobium sp. BK176]MCS4089949.1 hypothetical protein [Rhizobium sp. BK176]